LLRPIKFAPPNQVTDGKLDAESRRPGILIGRSSRRLLRPIKFAPPNQVTDGKLDAESWRPGILIELEGIDPWAGAEQRAAADRADWADWADWAVTS